MAALAAAEAAADRLGCWSCTCIMSAVAAEIWATVGDRERATTAAGRAIALAESLGRLASQGIAERALAHCAIPDDVGEAVAHATRTVASFRELGQPYELARSLRVLGSAVVATDGAVATVAWSEALGFAQHLGAEPERWALRRLMAR